MHIPQVITQAIWLHYGWIFANITLEIVHKREQQFELQGERWFKSALLKGHTEI